MKSYSTKKAPIWGFALRTGRDSRWRDLGVFKDELSEVFRIQVFEFFLKNHGLTTRRFFNHKNFFPRGIGRSSGFGLGIMSSNSSLHIVGLPNVKAVATVRK